MTVEELKVILSAETSGLTNGLNKAKGSISSFSKSASSAGNGISSFIKKAAGIAGVVVSLTALVKAGADCVNAANEQAVAETKLATIMKTRMGATDGAVASIIQYANELQKVGVVGDEAAIAGAQQVATYLEQASSIKTLLPSMENLAAQMYGTSVSMEQMVGIGNMFGKAIATNSLTQLIKAGILFTDVEKQAWETLTTEQEKAAFLAQVVQNNVGNMNAALAATPAGQIAQLKNNFGDLKETIGNMLTTALAPVVTFLNTIVVRAIQAAKAVSTFVSTLFGIKGASTKTTNNLGNMGASIGDAIGGTQSVANNLNKASKAAKETAKALKGLAGFDEINTLSSANADTGGGDTGGSSGDVEAPSISGGSIPMSIDLDTKGAKSGLSGLQKTAKDVAKRIKKDFSKMDFSKIQESADRLKTAFDNLKINNGLEWVYNNVLLPVAQWTIEDALPTFLDTLSSAFEMINKAGDTVVNNVLAPLWNNFLVPAAGFVADGITGFLQLLQDFFAYLGNNPDVAARLTGVAIAIGAVATAIKIVKAILSATNPTLVVIKLAISALILVLGYCYKHWDDIKKIVKTVVDAVVGFVKNLVNKVKTFFKNLWDGIVGIFKGIGKWFGDRFNDIVNVFKSIPSAIGNFFSSAWTKIKNVFKSVGTWFSTNVWDKITGVFKDAPTTLKKFFNDAWRNIKSVFSGIKTFFQDKWDRVVGLFETVGGTIADVFTDAFKTGINGAFGIIEGLLNLPIKAINGLLDVINAVPGIKIGKIDEIELPRLARGGIVNGATLAEIGEAGREAVIPLEHNTSWMETLALKIVGKMNDTQKSQPMYITLDVGGTQFGKVCIDAINQTQAKSGTLLLNI